MRRRHRVTVTLGVLAGLIAATTLAVPTAAAGTRLVATMSGAEEVPGPGDPDGSGTAVLRLNRGQGEICYQLTVSGIASATAAHIHIGPAGVAGPVVVPLVAPANGSVSACATVDRALIRAISSDPDQYYVNVHNAMFPAGAVRGQLSK